AADAKRNAARAEDRLARVYLTNGTQRLDAGDLLGSLRFFAEAQRIDEGDPDRDEIHRVRLATLFAHSPKLTHLWPVGSRCNSAAFASDGRLAVTGHEDGVARVWDLSTGELQWT